MTSSAGENRRGFKSSQQERNKPRQPPLPQRRISKGNRKLGFKRNFSIWVCAWQGSGGLNSHLDIVVLAVLISSPTQLWEFEDVEGSTANSKVLWSKKFKPHLHKHHVIVIYVFSGK